MCALFKPQFQSAAGDLNEGIAKEELSGLAYMLWGRLIVLGLLAAWALLTVPLERSGVYLAAIAAFALLGSAPYLFMRNGIGGTPLVACFLMLDAALLSFVLIVPTPFDVEGWTPQLNLRLPSFLYLGVFLVGMSLSYKPALVLTTGCSVVAAWSAGYLWVVSLPESVVFSARDVLGLGFSLEEVLQRYLDPNAVALTRLSTQIVFLVLVTIVLTVTVWRSRRLVRRQVAAEAQRSALSRYFSPNIARELATRNPAMDRPSVQPVAVLFADMVGFTGLSERLDPDALIELLRDFHGRLARTAFAHDGTVDKYIGDAIMVHFGTPMPKPDDPVRALNCASRMIKEIEEWNAVRRSNGQEAIEIGIGVHFGEVVVGNIGDANRLEYTVLGDTVNVASRLEHFTRQMGARLVVSADLVDAVSARGADPHETLHDLRREDPIMIRGRQEAVAIWTAGHSKSKEHG